MFTCRFFWPIKNLNCHRRKRLNLRFRVLIFKENAPGRGIYQSALAKKNPGITFLNMHPERIIYAASADEAFEQIGKDFNADRDLLEYSSFIEQDGRRILLLVDIDPGGGFESGFETTMLRVALERPLPFNFAIHHQGFFDELGKLFGMQDIETGYPEFDQKIMVKSDDEIQVKALFNDADVRATFSNLDNFKLQTHTEAADTPFLELTIDRGILNPGELKLIYKAFIKVLNALENPK